MGIYLTGVSNETILSEEDISSYSYSEEINSIEPSQIRGGSGQVNVSSRSGNFTVQEALDFVDTELTLTDSDLGTVPFKVTNITKDMSGMVSITGETLSERLNVEVTATPRTGSLKDAIIYYCGLVGVTPQFDSTGDAAISSQLTSRSINFIGWKGNLWEHLKMLCAGVSASTGSHVPFEMYVSNGVLRFRKALAETINLSEYETDRSIKIDSGNLADGIEMYNYNTSYKVNGLVYEQDRGGSGAGDQEDPENPLVKYPATTMAITCNAGETVEKIIKVNATLTSVNPAVAQDATTAIYPHPETYPTSRYFVYGSDNEPITASLWNSPSGGTVTLSLTDEPDEIKITVKAPAKPAEDTPGDEGGDGGSGNQTVTELASPSGLDADPNGGTNDWLIYWTAPDAAESYIISVTPFGGTTYFINSLGYYNPSIQQMSQALSLSGGFASHDIKIKAITDAGYDAATGESNKHLESAYSQTMTLVTSTKAVSLSGTGDPGTKATADTPGTDVNSPDVPGAPADGSSDANTAPTTLKLDSYKIGFKRAGDTEYPAFFITGTGTFFDKQLKKPEDTPSLSTGNDTQNKVGATIDNPFVTTDADFSFKSALAVNAYKFPEVTMDQGLAINGSFGNLIGKQQVIDNATFRIENVSYSQGDINVSSRKV